jgi:hypothetical protein
MANLSDRAGAPKFDALIDTPASKVGQAGLTPTVNGGETALEYIAKEGAITATTSADIFQGDKTFVPKSGLPISTLTQSALDLKEDEITATTSADIFQGDKTFVPKSGLPISTATQTALDLKVDESREGNANGIATLDGGGKIPSSQLPSSVMEYLGTWAASTNTPTLADGVGDNGDVYLASDAGTVDFGAGNITFAAGDWVVYSGTIWEKSLNSDSVVSVNAQTGVVVLDADDVSDSATTNKYTTAAEITKLGGIETLATADKPPSSVVLTPTTGAVALDWAASTIFTHAISGDSTFTISNQVAGETIAISLTSSGAFTPTFTGVLWAAGTAPGAMASSDIWVVTLIYDGANTLGLFQESFA